MTSFGIFRPTFYCQAPKIVDTEEGDEVNFVDSLDKHLDVFDFLEIERDDTSVSVSSSSSSSSSSSFDYSDDFSYASRGSTVYFDALHQLDMDQEIFDEDDHTFVEEVLRHVVIQELEDECSDSLNQQQRLEESDGKFITDHNNNNDDDINNNEDNNNNNNNNNKDDDNNNEENLIGHAIHFTQNVWQGSKKTPVGFLVNMTEDVVGGVFGHIVGMIHDSHGKVDSECSSSSPERAVAPSLIDCTFDAENTAMTVQDTVRIQTDLVNDELKRRMDISLGTDRPTQKPSIWDIDVGASVSSRASVEDDWLPLE